MHKPLIVNSLKMEISPLLLAVYVILTAYVTYKIFTSWDTLYSAIQRILTKHLMNIRHEDGHVMPGPPIRWKSYFDEVNFFGRDFSRVYGRVYHVWHRYTPVVVLADVDAIRSFYKDHFSHRREPDFSCCGPALKDIMGVAVGLCHGRDKAREYRGHFEPYFSTKFVRSQNELISQATDEWIASIPIGKSLDFGESALTDVALKTLTNITYGSDVMNHHLAEVNRVLQLHNEAVGSCGTGLRKFVYSTFRTVFPNRPNAKTRAFAETWGAFHKTLLEEREKGILKDTEGIFFLLYDQIQSGVVNLTYEQLIDTADEILLFNVDISFAATSFVIHDLGRHLDVQTKVRQEVDSVLGGRDPVTLDDLKKQLPYLNMVILESARMHPALGVTFPELTVKDETDMAGYSIPKDTIVCIDPHSVNYDDTYWPDPETFDPERFAPGRNHVPYSFFRFGLGPRRCLGYRLAHTMIIMVIVKLVQQFEISPEDPNVPLRIKTEGMPFFTPYLAPNIVLSRRRHTLDETVV